MIHPIIQRSDCVLRASRATKLAQRAVARGNYARACRLARFARALLETINPPRPGRDESGQKETDA